MEYKECWQIANIVNGFVFKSSQYVANGIRVIRIANVQDGYISDESPCYYPMEQEKNIGNAMLKENDLLMSLTGNVGRVAILDKSFLPAGLNQRVECIRPYDIKDNEYLYYYFRSKQFQTKAMSAATGSAQLNLSVEWVKKHKIPFYNDELRKSIVKELKSLDLALSIKKTALQSLDELVKSRFIEMFENKGFSFLPFSKYADIIDGDRGKNYPKATDFSDNGYCLFLNAKNVTKEGFSFEQTQFISKEKDAALRKGKLQRKDIVITTRGTIGNIAYYDETIPYDNIRINSGMVIIRPQNISYNPFFFLYAFRNKVEEIKAQNVTGAAQPQLPIHIMSKIQLLNPPIELQNEFAEFVKLIDKSKFIVQQQIKDLQELLDSKMDEYFR